MMFSATFACARCRLRFARRARCPECGGAESFSLATREGRARYRAATRAELGAWGGLLLRLAPWAPQRPSVTIAVGVLMMLPASLGLAKMGPSLFQTSWLMDDLTTRQEGLSSGGFALIGIAVAGAVVVAFTVAATIGSATAARVRPATALRMRVFSPRETARGDTTLTGIARRASVEVASAVSREPCLVYGIRGQCGGAEIADADGGDFDLELPSGERVMISLEHAVLMAEERGPSGERSVEIGSALAELLENRAIPDQDGRVAVDEELVRDGDEITAIGTLLGGTVTSLGYRGSSGARVLAGDEERPLVVRASHS